MTLTAVGFLAWSTGRSGRLSRASVAVIAAGAEALLVIGALAMLGFDDQRWQVLLTIPFGLRGWRRATSCGLVRPERRGPNRTFGEGG